MKKTVLIATLILGVVLGAFANGESETIKIGIAGPHTGDLAAYGIPTLEAAQIIANEINADGGINGKTIEIIIADDICDPAQATTVASKLVADEVVAVVGHVCSGATISAMATYQSAGVPIVSPSATNPTLTAGGYSGFFRTIAPDNKQGETIGNFLANTLNIKTAAVIHDQQDYGKGLADYSKASLEENGVTISIYEGVAVGAVDYSAVVSKIISAKVDAVMFGGYLPEGSKLISQLKERGYAGDFISGDGLKGEDFINIAGASAEGAYASGAKDYSANAEYKAALATYESEKGATPGTFYFEGHAAMTAIIEAIRAGNTTPSDVQNFLYSGKKFNSAVGSIYFNEAGDSVGTGFEVYQIQNGKFAGTTN